MKKKYRRAVCFTLIGIPFIIWTPFMCITWLMVKLSLGLWDYKEWLKTKLRIYDPD